MDQAAEQLSKLQQVMRQLLGDSGCPWDREQTHTSLARYLLEETYETLEAIQAGNMHDLQAELGDVLFQVVFHSALAEQSGAFSLADVIQGAAEKMIRRHPHVFGSLELSTSQQVVDIWEGLKKQEGKQYVLQGIPPALPALLHAQKLQEKAAGVGFDWDDAALAWDKFEEEMAEFKSAAGEEEQEEEMGDILFSLVNLCRFAKLDAEHALQRSNQKFIRRFAFIEQQVQQSGKDWADFTLGELDAWWEEAKKQAPLA